jgi:hypothetical protein
MVQGGPPLKRLLLPLVVASVLALPARSVASSHSYSGAVDPAGTLSFKVKKKHGKTRIKRFEFEQVPITCDAGPDTTFGHLEFAVKVKKKKFHAAAVHDPHGQQEGSTLKLDGKLTDKGRHVEGTLRVFGSPPLGSGSVGTSCHTGTRPWSADRE